MFVTVALCTWNRADILDQTLARFRDLRVPPGVGWELLAVDNNSPDGTAAVLARHAADGKLPLVPLFEGKQGLSHARNKALDHARGDWVLWTDDDVLVDPDWLTAAVAATERHPDAAILGGPIDPWFPHPPDPALVAAFPALKIGFCGLDYGSDERPLSPAESPRGANMGFRTKEAKGLRFDPKYGRSGDAQLLYDETDYINRMRSAGAAAWWVPGMRLAHYVEPKRMTLEHCLSHYRGAGQSSVTIYGPPKGPTLFGRPREWVLEAAKAGLNAWYYRLTLRPSAGLEDRRVLAHVLGKFDGLKAGRGK